VFKGAQLSRNDTEVSKYTVKYNIKKRKINQYLIHKSANMRYLNRIGLSTHIWVPYLQRQWDTIYFRHRHILHTDIIYFTLPHVLQTDIIYFRLPHVLQTDIIYFRLPHVLQTDHLFQLPHVLQTDIIYFTLPHVLQTDHLFQTPTRTTDRHHLFHTPTRTTDRHHLFQTPTRTRDRQFFFRPRHVPCTRFSYSKNTKQCIVMKNSSTGSKVCWNY
jgi:hypothetical protein